MTVVISATTLRNSFIWFPLQGYSFECLPEPLECYIAIAVIIVTWKALGTILRSPSSLDAGLHVWSEMRQTPGGDNPDTALVRQAAACMVLLGWYWFQSAARVIKELQSLCTAGSLSFPQTLSPVMRKDAAGHSRYCICPVYYYH